jgi:hypothetical protein
MGTCFNGSLFPSELQRHSKYLFSRNGHCPPASHTHTYSAGKVSHSSHVRLNDAGSVSDLFNWFIVYLTPFFNLIGSIASNGRPIMNGELETICKQAVKPAESAVP